MGSHTTEVTIEVCGIERTVTVDFYVENYGSSDSYFEPGDPVELAISDVTDLSGPGQYDKYAALPDLSMKYHRPWVRDEVTGAITCLDPIPSYGYGFNRIYCAGSWRFQFNQGRSLIDAMENELVERIDEFTSDGGDFDYEPSFYHPDTRDEHSV